ncbi:hypothetical protein RIN60_04135 [Kluyvera cryocrescens]|uniref:hypothetical protein n=1 Tax=Kluyvera cryocrescens TaxID=580 RepID=UPI0028BF0D87|nr:hypothetical protein [Kluyvera cryocrescens]WNN72562.1 hypothetical protein RIN60_04135 [Kluyvera cryocrescens]
MKAPMLVSAVLPLMLPFGVFANEKAAGTADYLKKISFHSPSMPGYRTADILTSGFVGASVTMSSNSKFLNLNDLTFRVSRNWLEVKPHHEGRVTLRMVRQPKADERATTLVIHNRKTGQSQAFSFYVKTWLTGDGVIDANTSQARKHCERLGGKLLTTQAFRDLSRQWFGLSSGYLREMYPEATLFNAQAQAGDSFWVNEGKSVYLHTGIKSHTRTVNTLCQHQYPALHQETRG